MPNPFFNDGEAKGESLESGNVEDTDERIVLEAEHNGLSEEEILKNLPPKVDPNKSPGSSLIPLGLLAFLFMS